MKIAVMIPAHNEEETVAKVIGDVKQSLSGKEYKIAVACNKCTDNTERIVDSLSVEKIVVDRAGLANVFGEEMRYALQHSPDVIVHIDADWQYDAFDIPSLLEWIDKGYDLVIGNRLHKQQRETKFIKKYVINKVGAFGYSILLRKWIPDATSGFRAFTLDVAKLPIVSENSYTQEQLWRAIKSGYKVKFVPVTFRKRVSGKSRLISSIMDYLKKSAKDFGRFSL